MKKILRFCQKAIIEKDGKILIVKTSDIDPAPFMWEVPGGGIDWGEDLKVGFRREIYEELGINFEIKIGDPFYVSSWVHPYHRDIAYAVWLFYICQYKKGEVVISSEHCDYKWIKPEEHVNYPMIDKVRGAFKRYIEIKKNLSNSKK